MRRLLSRQLSALVPLSPELIVIGVLQVLSMTVALIRAKLIAGELGPSGFGVVSVVDQTLVSLVQLGGFSLPLLALKHMSSDHSADPDAFQRSYAAYFRILLGLALLGSSSMAALLLAAPEILGADMRGIRRVLLIGVATVPSSMLGIFLTNTFASAQLPRSSAAFSLGFGAATALCAVTGVFVGGLTGLYTGLLVGGLVAVLAGLRHAHKRLGLHLSVARGGVLAELRRRPALLRYAVALYVALAAYSVAMLLPRYLVFDSLGAAEVGILQSQISVAASIGAVLAAMTGLQFVPRVNRSGSVAEKSKSAHEFASQVTAFMMIAGTVVASFSLLTISVLFSADFARAATWLFLFLVWQGLFHLWNVYSHLMIGLDDMRWYAIVTCSAYLVLAGLLRPLVERFGIVGVGLAFALSALCGLAATLARLRYMFGVRFDPAWYARLAVCIGSIAAAGHWFGSTSVNDLAGLLPRLAFLGLVLGAIRVGWSGLTRIAVAGVSR